MLRYDGQIEAALVIMGLVLPLIGWQRALRLLDELQVHVGVGGGALIYVVVLALVIATRIKTHDPGRARVVVQTPQG